MFSFLNEIAGAPADSKDEVRKTECDAEPAPSTRANPLLTCSHVCYCVLQDAKSGEGSGSDEQ
jgi:hypothetical protein